MKGAIAIAAASAALASAVATPAKIEARASSSSSGSVPTVTVKGNGKGRRSDGMNSTGLMTLQPSSLEMTDSTFAVSIISQADRLALQIPLRTSMAAREMWQSSRS